MTSLASDPRSRLASILDAVGLDYQLGASAHGEPRAGFRLVRPSGETVACAALLRTRALQLVVRDVVPAPRAEADLWLWNEVNKRWPLGRVVWDARSATGALSSALFVDDEHPAPAAVSATLSHLLDAIDEVRAFGTPTVSLPSAPSTGSLHDLDAALGALGYAYEPCHGGAARRLSFGTSPGRDAFLLELSAADDRLLFARATPVGDPPLGPGRPTIDAVHALNASLAMGTVFVGASRTHAAYFIAVPLACSRLNLDTVQHLVGRCGATVARLRAELPHSR